MTVYRTIIADPPWQPTMALINGPASGIGAPKGSPQRQKITLEKYEINPAVDDVRFKMPEVKK